MWKPRSYKIATRDGVIYRKMQVHLKPYESQKKTVQSCMFYNEKVWMQTVKTINKANTSNNLAQCRPKTIIKPPFKLNLERNSNRSEKVDQKLCTFLQIGLLAGQSEIKQKSVYFELKIGQTFDFCTSTQHVSWVNLFVLDYKILCMFLK